MSIEPSPSRVQRVRHEIKRRLLQVVRTETISPHFRAITFAGEELAGFVSASFDDHIKFILDDGKGGEIKRDYTPRRYDPIRGELTLEFALHGDGPAASWAQNAVPGQQATIAGPRGSFVIPADYAWHLLIGDETALPAVSRRMEELQAGARVLAILQTDDSGDRRNFQMHTNSHVQWVADADQLLASLRALVLPVGEGYAWCAGEAGTMAAVRRILVEEKGHSRHHIRAAAYWKQGASGHHENLES
jgi:NADPH-dependent ferric siderophore reductase